MSSFVSSELASYRGRGVRPSDFDSFWLARLALAEKCPELAVTPHPELVNVRATYSETTLAATDGHPIVVRRVEPTAPGPHPCVVMFHDMGRGVRGWHHMTRFVAAGYGVVALANRAWTGDLTGGAEAGPAGLAMTQLVDDALVAATHALGLPWVDRDLVVTWGEGLGGALAVATAGVLGGRVARCAAANVMPADLRASWESGYEQGAYQGFRSHFRDVDPTGAHADKLFSTLAYVDPMHFSPMIEGELLVGIGLANEVSAPAAQFATYNRASCAKRVVSYPKWGHERINDFEDEVLVFLHH